MKSKQRMSICFGIAFALMIASITMMIGPVSATTSDQEHIFPDKTPLQNSIMENMGQSESSKYSIMSTSNTSFNPSNVEYKTEVLEKSKNHIKLKGTTIIQFANPIEAGHSDNKWPKIQISENPEFIEEGTVVPGEYDQAIKDYILSQIQEIEDEEEREAALSAWENYDFESGPREHTITEYYEITYPEESQSVMYYAAASDFPAATNDVLMGFTYEAPNIDWIIEDRVTIIGFEIAHYKAGIEFDAALGLRLPAEVTINHPSKMYEPGSHIMSSSINGVDWNADQYIAANVPAENGNEFVARMDAFAGIIVEILGKTVGDSGIDIDKDYGDSFETPFGPDEEFPLQSLSLSPDDTGLKWGIDAVSLGIGLTMDPNIGSETINADWTASGDATGKGTIIYSHPDELYNFGPLIANTSASSSNYADIQLSDFEYHFDKCNFDLYANIDLEILSIDFDIIEIPIIHKDVSEVTGGLYVGVHEGTNADSANVIIPVIEENSYVKGMVYSGKDLHDIIGVDGEYIQMDGRNFEGFLYESHEKS
ncbi:hypothetical protein [Methanohalophilus halophilus]|uniref:Uncharacterized protein n=1 Tax=Methanohalophilus halophilus TaxID=2177 RepID=A0A1L3Q3N2_9EURY|nr:hypothetical protein [Methanohalophilus halophilus]APH39492.1 hypothetical protein BHR79_08375 [Methanohalophilus halophilus]RNI09173.1 hypothetical protein EFE40_06900 [Methanohalophilus halophilus]SDW28035.1 hypothetical protein SAMN04515625_0583 [Methanohalophilus halophilus]